MMRFAHPSLLLRDLDVYKQIFVKDFDNFVDHQKIPFSEELDPIFTNSLIFLRGKKKTLSRQSKVYSAYSHLTLHQ